MILLSFNIIIRYQVFLFYYLITSLGIYKIFIIQLICVIHFFLNVYENVDKKILCSFFNFKYVCRANASFMRDFSSHIIFQTLYFSQVYDHPPSGPYSTIDRRYLNPRLRARKIRFVFPKIYENKDVDFMCFRVELYGANLGRHHFVL